MCMVQRAIAHPDPALEASSSRASSSTGPRFQKARGPTQSLQLFPGATSLVCACFGLGVVAALVFRRHRGASKGDPLISLQVPARGSHGSRTWRADEKSWEAAAALDQLAVENHASTFHRELLCRARKAVLDSNADLESTACSKTCKGSIPSNEAEGRFSILALRGGGKLDRERAKAQEEDTRGSKAKAQKEASAAEKRAKEDAANKKKEDEDWEQGADKRGSAKAKAKEEKELAEMAKKKAKAEADAQEAAEVAAIKSGSSKARKAERKAGDVSRSFEKGASPFEPTEEDRIKLQIKLGLVPKVEKKTTDYMDSAIPGVRNKEIAKQQEGTYSASGLSDSLKALEIATKGVTEDAHPEKRAKALYKAFEEREMLALRKEYPDLKRTQLLERIWKMWQKSPENPLKDKM